VTPDAFDRDEIEALILRYADCVDRGDFDGLADLFTHGVIHAPIADFVGRDAVRATYDNIVFDEHGSPGTHHVVFDVEVDVDPSRSRASAFSYLTVVQHGRPIVAGRYVDEFVRDAGGWRFASRTIHLDLIGDLSRHFHAPRTTRGPG
jgi:ketosteroid isomerase-like protein